MNPWVKFNAPPCGNGAETFPFNLLDDAVSEAETGAIVSIVPGADSTETFTGGDTLGAQMSLTNSDPGSGPVSIGISARRDTGIVRPKTGFVSRSRN